MRYHRTLSVDVEVHGTEMLMRHSSGEKPYTEVGEDAAERFILEKHPNQDLTKRKLRSAISSKNNSSTRFFFSKS